MTRCQCGHEDYWHREWTGACIYVCDCLQFRLDASLLTEPTDTHPALFRRWDGERPYVMLTRAEYERLMTAAEQENSHEQSSTLQSEAPTAAVEGGETLPIDARGAVLAGDPAAAVRRDSNFQLVDAEANEQETTLQSEAPSEPAPAAAVGLVDTGQPTELQALCRELAEAEALVLKVLVLNPLIDVVYRCVSDQAARDVLEQAICDQAAVLAERLAVFAATLKQDEAGLAATSPQSPAPRSGPAASG